MKSLFAAFLLGILSVASVGAASAAPTVSREAALQAIEVFRKDPAGSAGLAAGTTIMSFAQKSNEVHVSLSKAVAPWYKTREAPDADTRIMLLTAYVAGNARAQLQSGKAEDDVYAGWQQVLATYDQLRQINPTVKLPEIEDLKAKERGGTLRSYAATVLAQQKAGSPGAKSANH